MLANPHIISEFCRRSGLKKAFKQPPLVDAILIPESVIVKPELVVDLLSTELVLACTLVKEVVDDLL